MYVYRCSINGGIEQLIFPFMLKTCFKAEWYRISGKFGAMEILALLADDKNTPNLKAPIFPTAKSENV